MEKLADIDFVVEVLKLIFGKDIPIWAFELVGWALLIALLLAFVALLLRLGAAIQKVWRSDYRHLFYNPEQRRRCRNRQRFASHIMNELNRLDGREEWKDYRFAELEAEVEAEGKGQLTGFVPWGIGRRGGLRRERSLSKAIRRSSERLILLEGEPGSGKSVALRHVARQLAEKAERSRDVRSTIPFYINLKELEKDKRGPVTAEAIREFICSYLNRVNDRDIEEFLDHEFEKGLQEGTWLFLFDSFDEIPEVLSSTESDAPVRAYSEALSDFLGGMNACRGIVASRHFRGPDRATWPKFRIVPLTEKRRFELIRNADLDPETAKLLNGQLPHAEPEIRNMATNPMFLSLLCEHMRAGLDFPSNTHTVFESYVTTRLERDAIRLHRRFGISGEQVRKVAERAAFCMTSNEWLGLSPSRAKLTQALRNDGFCLDIEDIDIPLDALEFIKIARGNIDAIPGEPATFTFAHRRFQEYFATCVVLAEPDLVSATELITDGRWRETAVVSCQLQSLESLEPILNELRSQLEQLVVVLPDVIKTNVPEEKRFSPADKEAKEPDASSLLEGFDWPPRTAHLLSILQDGFRGRMDDIPEDIRTNASAIILTAFSNGTRWDKKIALELAGSIPKPHLLELVRAAFAMQSQWLREVAYRQLARLDEIPSDLHRPICKALISLFSSGRIHRERNATYAHLSRLEHASKFLNVLRLLIWLPRIDLFLMVGAILTLRLYSTESASIGMYVLLLYLFGLWIAVVTRDYHNSLVIRVLLLVFTLPLLAATSIVLGIDVEGVLRPLEQTGFLLFAVFYAVMWAPLAVTNASWGRFAHPVYWPLAPFLVFPNTLADLVLEFRTNLRRLAFLLGAIAIPVLLIILIKELDLSPETKEIIVLVFVSVLIISYVIRVLVFCADRVRLRIFERASKSEYSVQAATRDLESYLTTIGQTNFIDLLAKRGILQASQENVEELERYAISLEKVLADKSPLFRRLNRSISSVAKRVSGGIGFAAVDDDLVDRVYILIDQLRQQTDRNRLD